MSSILSYLFFAAFLITVQLPFAHADDGHGHGHHHNHQAPEHGQVFETIAVRDHLHVLKSQFAGNVTVSSGPDGLVLIDDQLAGNEAALQAAAHAIQQDEIRFILNTHYHFDHTGGNEVLGGKGAVIIAHENNRTRLSEDQFIELFQKEQKALSADGLPVITFTKDMALHLNGDKIAIYYVADAHTDGDAIAHFEKQNVVVAGDIIFHHSYPFIDVQHGGSIQGMIAATELILELSDAGTKIVPGHGPVMDKAEVEAYLDFLSSMAENVEAEIARGKSLQQVLAMKLSTPYDAARREGLIQPDQFVTFIYQSFAE